MRKWLKWIDQCCCEVCNLFPQKIYFEHFTLNKEVRIETPTQKSRHPLFAEHQQLPKSSDSEMRRFQVLIDSIFTERPNSPIMCLHHWFWCYSIIFIYTFIISYYCTYILYRIYIHITRWPTLRLLICGERFLSLFLLWKVPSFSFRWPVLNAMQRCRRRDAMGQPDSCFFVLICGMYAM